MRVWQIVIAIVLLILLTLLILPRLKYLSVLSPQGELKTLSFNGEFDPTKTRAIYDNQPVTPPLAADKDKQGTPVLGETDQSRRIEIDLTNQRIYAYEGNQKIYDFLISSGKWGRTPVGRFQIWTKLRYVLMTGGSQALGTYYYLPNVPYTMFFYNNEVSKWQGYGIHGTYWHSNFGHPMSHGCINMNTDQAGLLYYWANDNPGTEIIIYGEAPYE